MRKSYKIFVLTVVLLMVSVAAAGLLKYFNQINIQADVHQAITINGHLSDTPIEIKTSMVAGDTHSEKFTLINHANSTINITATNKIPQGFTVDLYLNHTLMDFPYPIPPGKHTLLVVVSTDVRVKQSINSISIKIGPSD